MKIANTLSSVLGVVLLLIALQWIFMPASIIFLSDSFREGSQLDTSQCIPSGKILRILNDENIEIEIN